jgi:hypothetical protein
MKTPIVVFIAAAAITVTSTTLADKYDDLAKQGYRWITTEGPFACRSKEDVQRVIKNGSANDVQLVTQLHAYFLIRGAVVQLIQEDKTSGLSQVDAQGMGYLWMPSRFLSKRPIASILGTIFTPWTPLNWTPSSPASPTVNIGGASPVPGATATPNGEATPSASATP